MVFADESTSSRIGLDKVMSSLRPLSPFGKLMKERMRVYGSQRFEQVQREWNLVESLLYWSEQGDDFLELETTLHQLRDVRGIVNKTRQGYVLEDVELFELKRFLEQIEQVLHDLDKLRWKAPLVLKLPRVPLLLTSLAPGGVGGFYLDDSFDPNLAKLRKEQRNLKAKRLKQKLAIQEQVSRETGLKFNPAGRLKVSKAEAGTLKELMARRDLVVNSETYSEVEFVLRSDDLMLELDLSVGKLQEQIESIEWVVRKKLSSIVAEHSRQLLAMCRRLGIVDLLLAKMRLAREIGWCKPEIIEGARIELEEFINPVVNEHLTVQGMGFQPLSLDTSTRVTVITGANMGGKSVLLKSIGLAVAMAQMGLLVPAKSFKFSLRDFIYYSQQNEDPDQGLSTFGAEMQSLSAVLPQKELGGLYLLDEPARGTNPWEGSALVKAIVAWLNKGNSLTVVATHFPGLSNLDGATHFQVAGLAGVSPEQFSRLGKGGVEGLQVLMDYSLVPGRGDIPRDALKVAAFLGLERDIIDRASQELGLLPREVLK